MQPTRPTAIIDPVCNAAASLDFIALQVATLLEPSFTFSLQCPLPVLMFFALLLLVRNGWYCEVISGASRFVDNESLHMWCLGGCWVSRMWCVFLHVRPVQFPTQGQTQTEGA